MLDKIVVDERFAHDPAAAVRLARRVWLRSIEELLRTPPPYSDTMLAKLADQMAGPDRHMRTSVKRSRKTILNGANAAQSATVGGLILAHWAIGHVKSELTQELGRAGVGDHFAWIQDDVIRGWMRRALHRDEPGAKAGLREAAERGKNALADALVSELDPTARHAVEALKGQLERPEAWRTVVTEHLKGRAGQIVASVWATDPSSSDASSTRTESEEVSLRLRLLKVALTLAAKLERAEMTYYRATPGGSMAASGTSRVAVGPAEGKAPVDAGSLASGAASRIDAPVFVESATSRTNSWHEMEGAPRQVAAIPLNAGGRKGTLFVAFWPRQGSDFSLGDPAGRATAMSIARAFEAMMGFAPRFPNWGWFVRDPESPAL